MTPVDKPDAAMDWADRAARAVNDTLDVHQINDSAIAEIIRRHAAAEKPKGIAVEAELRDQLADLQSTFDLRWQSDQRAIKRWQEATGRTDTWPDHADLVVWLMEQLAERDQRIQAIAETIGVYRGRAERYERQIAYQSAKLAELRKTVTGYQQGLATGLVALAERELSGLKEAGDRMAAMLETAPSEPVENWPTDTQIMDAVKAWRDAARKEAQ